MEMAAHMCRISETSSGYKGCEAAECLHEKDDMLYAVLA